MVKEMDKNKLMNIMMLNNVSSSDITEMINEGKEGSSWTLDSVLKGKNPIPANVASKICIYLDDHNIKYDKDYLYNLDKVKDNLINKKKTRNPDGATNKATKMPDQYTDNHCNKKAINNRLSELGWKKSLIRWWFSFNVNKMNNIINGTIKDIDKNHQALLAYFCNGSISNLAIGYKKAGNREAYVQTENAIYKLGDPFDAILDNELEGFLKSAGISPLFWDDMKNGILTMPIHAAEWIQSVFNKQFNTDYSFDDLFININEVRPVFKDIEPEPEEIKEQPIIKEEKPKKKVNMTIKTDYPNQVSDNTKKLKSIIAEIDKLSSKQLKDLSQYCIKLSYAKDALNNLLGGENNER